MFRKSFSLALLVVLCVAASTRCSAPASSAQGGQGLWTQAQNLGSQVVQSGKGAWTKVQGWASSAFVCSSECSDATSARPAVQPAVQPAAAPATPGFATKVKDTASSALATTKVYAIKGKDLGSKIVQDVYTTCLVNNKGLTALAVGAIAATAVLLNTEKVKKALGFKVKKDPKAA